MIYSGGKASYSLGTVIRVNKAFLGLGSDTYYFARPDGYGEAGLAVYGFSSGGRRPPNGVALVVGAPTRVNKSSDIPSVPGRRNRSVLTTRKYAVGFFVDNAGNIRRFDAAGNCKTVRGDPTDGC